MYVCKFGKIQPNGSKDILSERSYVDADADTDVDADADTDADADEIRTKNHKYNLHYG